MRAAEARAGRVVAEARDAVAQARADAARERDELREALNARAQVLEESRAELRERADRAARDLAAARAELDRLRAAGDAGPDAPGGGPARPRRDRHTQRPRRIRPPVRRCDVILTRWDWEQVTRATPWKEALTVGRCRSRPGRLAGRAGPAPGRPLT